MPKQPDYFLVVADPSKPERSLTPAKVLATAKAPATGQRIYWVKGAGMPQGFGLVVRPPTTAHSGLNATWVVQANDPNGKSVRLKIARYGDVPVPAVVEQAIDLRGRIHDGTHKVRKVEAKAAADRNAFTVGDAFRAWAEHLVQHRRPSVVRNALGKDGKPEHITDGTLKAGYVLGHFGDWLKKPLAEITETALRDRHAKITRDGGPATANRVMKSLRAAWSRAWALNKQLPANLLKGGEDARGWAWNDENEADQPVIDPQDLPGWWQKVHDLPPVRRDWNLFALFTAARRNDVKMLRWKDVDWERGTVRFREPKGGPKKAYTIPVCTFIMDLLRKRQAENRIQFGDDKGYVFPTRHRTEGVTYLRQPAEYRYVDGKKVPVLPRPHTLRRTWITAADEVISSKKSEVLANHTKAANANRSHRGYKIPGEAALRAAAEAVATYLLKKAGATATIRALNARSSAG